MSENENKSAAAEIVDNSAEVKSRPKKSPGKLICKIVGIVLIVIVALVLLALWQLDRVAATVTREVGSMITGTKVDVKSISIRPLAGSVKVKDFTVGNPEGFHNPVAIKVGNFLVAVNTASVLTDKIVVDHLEITDVAIDLEASLSQGSNLDAILKNVEKNTGADKKQAEAADTEEKEPAPQKQVVIRKLILKNSKVTISSGMLKTTMSVPLVPIEMENVGEGTDLAGAVKEVLVRIITEIGNVVDFKAVGKGFTSGADAVGKGASAVGRGVVDGVSSVGKGATAVGEGVVGGVDAVGKGATAVGKGVVDGVDGAVDGTVKFLKKLPGLGK